MPIQLPGEHTLKLFGLGDGVSAEVEKVDGSSITFVVQYPKENYVATNFKFLARTLAELDGEAIWIEPATLLSESKFGELTVQAPYKVRGKGFS